MSHRSGIGFDAHPVVLGRQLVLGGIAIPFEKGLNGHSDGDVLVHAIIDALLGAAGLGDIGTHFPSNDPRFSGIDSILLLHRTNELIRQDHWQVTFIDATIVAEKPTLKPFIGKIKHSLAKHLELEDCIVNIKATTTDGLGFIGRSEGMGAICIATINPS